MHFHLKRASYALLTLVALLLSPMATAKDGVIEIKGTVQSMPAGGGLTDDYTIAGKTVRANGQTNIDQEEGPLVVGAKVEVKGTAGEGGIVLATKIEVQGGDGDSGGGDDDGPPPPGTTGTPVEFKGLVESMPAGGTFVGDWMIAGRKVHTNASTRIDQEDGGLIVGATVEVRGVEGDGGTINATKIEVKSSSAPGTGDDEEDDDGSDGEIKGPIEALPDGTFIGTWKVAGKNVIVLSTTRLDQEHGAFVLGAIVEVEGTPSEEGLIARKIETKSSSKPDPEPEDDLLEIHGLIEALPPDGLIGTWKVSGRDVVVSAATTLEAEGGPFEVGKPVEVKGFPLDGGAIEATKIESKPGNGAPVPALAFFGKIEALPPTGLLGVWTIGGKVVNVSATTKLKTENGPFVLGADVKVEGWQQVDGAIDAHEIETKSASSASDDTGKVAVEFFNAQLGHFFMTASKSEIQKLDSGAFGGAWARTGQQFTVGGDSGVCRFYGMPPKGPSSHFFTVSAAECKHVMDAWQAWTFEAHAFGITPAVDGTCPAGMVAVRRFYNNPAQGSDINHRYVVSAEIAAQMIAAGWIDEGVVMCAQP